MTPPANDNAPEPLGAATEELEAAFRRAGATELALRASRLRPAGLSACWPEFPRSWLAYDPKDPPRIRPPVPSAADIEHMDRTYRLMRICLPGNHPEVIRLRQLILLRSLTDPISGRSLYSWNRIGEQLGISREWARREHALALRLILARLAGIGVPANDNAAGTKRTAA